MDELKDFLEISKYAGERYDLIQAGGGNSSVKTTDGRMYIKSSGAYLSEVSENYGFSIVRNSELLKIFENKEVCKKNNERNNDKIMTDYLNNCNLTSTFRPSIETLLHSMLKKYTLHTHPIVVNAILNRKNWREVLTKLFGDEIILANYKTPGLNLALELKEKLLTKTSKIIFLQNHGLIVTSDDKNDIKIITENIISKIEHYLNVDMSKYKLVSELSNLINNDTYNYIAYLSQDEYLNTQLDNDYIYTLPFCPDKMVYCGVKTLQLGEQPKIDIQKYKDKYFDIPRIIVYKNHLFFIASNVKKAKEIEDVFKFHILSLTLNEDKNVNFLAEDEIEYLGNWEAEKYRQKI